jgi:hypothetical protein
MADWLNHVAIAGPRNGTTTHTVTPSAGTVASGTLFTPTAGRFLLCLVEGGVTSTTPTSWTLPAGGSAVNNSGLYAWYRASAAGSDSITTTHNASNYPVVFDFYEFPSGSTFSGVASATAVSNAGGAGPTLTGLTGTNWICGVIGQANGDAANTYTTTWNAGTEITDTSVVLATTDGYNFSTTALDSSANTSQSFAATTAYSAVTAERLVIAIKSSAATAAPARIRTIGKRR